LQEATDRQWEKRTAQIIQSSYEWMCAQAGCIVIHFSRITLVAKIVHNLVRIEGEPNASIMQTDLGRDIPNSPINLRRHRNGRSNPETDDVLTEPEIAWSTREFSIYIESSGIVGATKMFEKTLTHLMIVSPKQLILIDGLRESATYSD